MVTLLPQKKDVALALLERASVFVHLDPRGDHVQVPSWFKRQAQLVLQVGLNMPVRIPDLKVADDAIACTLSFNRAPFYCFVPWSAVYALVGEDGRGMVWPEDIPPEVSAQTQSLGQRPKLHAVPTGQTAGSNAEGASLDPATAPASSGAPSSRSAGASRSARSQRTLSLTSARDPEALSPRPARGSGAARQSVSPGPVEPQAPQHDAEVAGAASARPASPLDTQRGPHSARPVLTLSGSKRRQGASQPPPPSVEPVSSKPIPQAGPTGADAVTGKSTSSSSGQHPAVSETDSVSEQGAKDRPSRSSERPYLRLVK